MRFDLAEVLWIVVIAFIGVWLVDKALNAAGFKTFAINNT